MARLNVNPNAEVNTGFDVVKPGTYRMRIREVRTMDDNGQAFVSSAGNTCWRVQFEYADLLSLYKQDGTPAKNPGTIWDAGLVISPADKQGKLRGLVEAAGLTWTDLDSDDLVGRELDVRVKLGTDQNGEQRNEIARYVPVKA